MVAALETHLVGESEMRSSDLLDEWRELELSSDTWLVELDGWLAGSGGYLRPSRRLEPRRVGSHLLELVETEARWRGIAVLRDGVIDNDQRAHGLLSRAQLP